MNGIMSKAGAGLGQGLALAGQMGLQAKLTGDLEAQRGDIMAQRDQVIQGYENQRNAATNTAHLAATKMSSEAHVAGMKLYADQRENKLIYHDGVVFKDGQPDVEASKIAGELTRKYGAKKTPALLQDMQGLVDAGVATDMSDDFLKQHPDKEQGLPKLDKDIDQRVNDLRSTISARMGNGFLEKLTEPDRKDFDTLFTKASKMIRNKSTMEDAYASVVDDLDRLKAKVSAPGGGGNSNAGSILDRFGVPKAR